MKKLMTMIAAVATAFGLFADEPTYNGTSFESAEAGVTELKWTPASGFPAGVWSTTITDDLDLGAYDGDKYDYPTGAPRRDDQFKGGIENNNYLKLDTGSATVDRTVANGQLFYDQVIKFTGFEDVQTNFVDGTKIAIWTSAIEDDEDTKEVNEADTNLYVSVGDGLGKTVNVRIAKIGTDDITDEFDLTDWHRVTIKNVGEVAAGRAGFMIWIDGKMASIDTEGLYFKEQVTAFKSYYDKGQLFISMDGTSATVANIGFQGVGSLDDVVVDEDGPAFTILTVDVTFAELDAATIEKVVDEDKNEFTDFTNPISVKPGQLTVTLTAKPGWILKNATKTVDTKDAVDGKITITLTEEDAVKAVAKIGATYFEKVEEALAAVEAAQKLDPMTPITVEFLQDCGDEAGNYNFTPNTTITVTEGGNWTVAIKNYEDEDGETAFGTLIDKFGAMPEKQIIVGGDANYTFKLSGNIYGNGRKDTLVSAGTVTIAGDLTIGNTLNVEEGAGAILKADSITFGTKRPSGNYSIALVGKGKVMTKVNTLKNGEITVPADEDLEVVGPDADSYFTYQIKAAPKSGFMLLISGVETYFPLLADAIAAASDGDTITAVGELALQKGIYINKNMFPTQGLTINLANTTYLVSKPGEGDKGTETQAFHIESGNKVTIKDGTIACPADMKDYTWAADAARDEKGISRMINNYGELTLNNVAVDASNMAKSFYGQGDARHAGTAYAVSGKNSGDLILTGNSSITAREAVEGYASYAFDTDTGVSVTVNGATINGDVELAAGNLALTAGTLNGKLVAGADNLGTVTKAAAFTFTGSIPEGYKWDADGKLVKIEYATLTIKQVDNCTVAVSNADNTAEIETGAKFDKDLAVKLNVYRVAAEGYELDNCAATEEITMTEDYEATATVKEKAADKPSAAPGSNVKVDEDLQNPGTFIVTPTGDSKNVVIQNVKAGNVIQVDGSAVDSVAVDNAEGVSFKVMNKSFDITGACEGLTEKVFSTELDGTKSVQVGTETIKVEPEIATTDASGEKVEPMVITEEAVTIQVKTIPGLTYQLVKKTVLDGKDDWTAVGDLVDATAARAGLTAAKTEDPASFYKIKVAK